MKFSLCMIVKNEEAVLNRCLESMASAMDEIIIVDTGSIDATKKIAAAYLYKQTICYLPAVHLQIKQAGFPSGFLKYVCRLRLPVFLMIAVSALTNAAPAAFAAIAFISGVSAAVVITSATMLFGITGILQALALFLPHFIFYIFGYWALYELAYKRSEFRLGEQIGILFRIALIWAVGIGSEVLLAPLVVTKIFVA